MNLKILKLITLILFIIFILTSITIIIYNSPRIVVKRYFYLLNKKSYSDLIDLVNLPKDYSKEDFINRNKNIYTGIDASNINIKIKNVFKEKNKTKVNIINKMYIKNQLVEFENTITLSNIFLMYKIDWNSNIIFPELENHYKVRVRAIHAKRGELLDRNNNKLAYYGEISNVGIIPGKLNKENKKQDLEKISQLLNINIDTIYDKLSKDWITDDIFVSLKNISKDNNTLNEELLKIPGILINTENDRIYPYKEAVAHVTGYISSITAEELEEKKDQGYSSTSVIGKSGLEKAFEERLKGTDGIGIYIENEYGTIVKKIITTETQDGENIKLTIDANLQVQLYEQLKNEEGFFVVTNPKTGEVLALISTPSYDPNKFILGMTTNEWNSIINGEGNPLYSKFLSSWCPGSTMKPLTGAIGLTSGKLSINDTFEYTGLAWKKDYWTDHEITTLTAYNAPKNLKNALIYSDNIYFAQATLQIGEETFTQGLDTLMFNKDIGFTLSTSNSQYSNEDQIKSEGLLADSGYGQGQILVNPIHMASIYSAFINDGNMLKPYIEYKEEKNIEYLVKNAFSKEAANEIKDCLIQVVENPSGTGHDVKLDNISIAGKTGTAELKATKNSTGNTLGWFNCFTTDQNEENSLLIISMAKNQNSRYLKQIIKTLFNNNQKTK